MGKYFRQDVFVKKICVSGAALALIVFFCAGVSAQGTVPHSAFSSEKGLDTLLQRFDRYRAHNLQEKLFVHTDRSFYLAGEILWFKVYSVSGAFNRPLPLSRVAYLELLDTAHKPVLQTKIALKQCSGNGSLYLPFSLPSGYYELRAYTKRMENFSPAYYFRQVITVVNTTKGYGMPPRADSAAMQEEDGPAVTRELPAVQAEGYGMQVSDAGSGRLKVTVRAPQQNSAGEPLVYLLAHTRQSVKFAAAEPLENGVATFFIRRDALGDGVSQLAVFNNALQSVCERFYYKPPQEHLIIKATTDKPVYASRRKVTIGVTTASEAGAPLAANMSVSVYRLDSLPSPPAPDISRYLWLSSDLIPPTAYKTPSFSYVPEHAGHIISGRITDTRTGKPAADVLVYLSVPGKRVQLYGCRSNDEGMVHFDMKDFYGPQEIVVQTDPRRDSTYRIDILSPYSEKFADDPWPRWRLTAQWRRALAARSLSMEVQSAYAASERSQFERPAADTLAFYGKPYKTYLLDDYTRFTTMEEVMREYVPEVMVRKRNGDFHFPTISMPAFEMQGAAPMEVLMEGDPLVLLDGVPVFDINKIIAFDPLKVEKLEVVPQQYFWGPITASGIVSYTTYKGDLGGFRLDPDAVVLDYEGLQLQRKFYAPVYENERQLASRIPDFRDLLYWSPSLATDAGGKGQLSFYTSDLPGTYRVVILGITAGGRAGSYSFTFQVKK